MSFCRIGPSTDRLGSPRLHADQRRQEPSKRRPSVAFKTTFGTIEDLFVPRFRERALQRGVFAWYQPRTDDGNRARGTLFLNGASTYMLRAWPDRRTVSARRATGGTLCFDERSLFHSTDTFSFQNLNRNPAGECFEMLELFRVCLDPMRSPVFLQSIYPASASTKWSCSGTLRLNSPSAFGTVLNAPQNIVGQHSRLAKQARLPNCDDASGGQTIEIDPAGEIAAIEAE